MAHRFLRDPETDGWEPSDFPILCQSCLGECPYIRMLRSADYDKGCNICTTPFTVCRWKPGRDARYKQTLICRTCTKLKNVCQVCLLDLQYGLPVQLRDTAMAIHSHGSIPKSDADMEYYADRKAPPSDTILKVQRTTPYYKRNRAPPCTFYARGACNRGAECPYRHEMPVTGELSRQNIKGRYYGGKDPVAEKLLKKACQMPSLTPYLSIIPPPPSRNCYPSMDPQRMGAVVSSQRK